MSDINKTRIIVLPIIPWSAIFQRPQQIPSHLARLGYQVLYINPSHGRPAGLVCREKYTDGYVYEGYTTSCQYHNLIRDRLTKDAEVASSIIEINDQLSQATSEPESYILMVQVPYWNGVSRILRSKLDAKQIYDVMDNFLEFDDLRIYTDILGPYHQVLLKDSIVLYTASTMLNDKYLDGAASLIHIPNAVDIELWDVLRHIGESIGYFGVLAGWTDISLLSKLGQYFRTEIIAPHPGKQENIPTHTVYLDRKDGAELVGFASRWSCGLIPFKHLPITHHTNPVKLYEMMAIGLPIVSRETQEIRNIANTMPDEIQPQLVDSDNSQLWTYAISAAIAQDSEEKTELRKVWARENTWTQRAKTIQEIIK